MKRLHCIVEFTDGTVMEVETSTADYLRYETTAKRHGWPTMQDSPARWEAFSAWSALERSGAYTKPWETFLEEVGMVDGAPKTVRPTEQANTDA